VKATPYTVYLVESDIHFRTKHDTQTETAKLKQ